MCARAEENIEESPDPSEEAFFTTSSSLTATHRHFATTVSQMHEIQGGERGTHTRAGSNRHYGDGDH
jgi:hypothetical protein